MVTILGDCKRQLGPQIVGQLRHHFGPNRALFVKSMKLGRSILPCILINSGYMDPPRWTSDPPIFGACYQKTDMKRVKNE